MKNVILFGMGDNGKKILDAYLRYDKWFHIAAVADNFSELREYAGIPVIRPERIPDFQYDEIWIVTLYYHEVKEQLTGELHIAHALIRYVEYPMPFLEQQIYARYREEMEGRKCCDSHELHEVIRYAVQNGVRMYCYPFFDEYMEKIYPVSWDVESGLYYGVYAGHRMYLSRRYDTRKKAEQYLRCLHMEQDHRSPHCYLAGDFQIEKGEVGVDVGAAEGVFALDVIDRADYIYLIEADAGWCEALSWTFREWQQKVTIIQGSVSDSEESGQIVLDKLFGNRQIDFMKMDIEGAEKRALTGAQELLKENAPKLAVCTYHKRSDYQDISEWLSQRGYTVKSSRGYVVCQGEWELEHLSDVDFRRALIWAERGQRMRKLAICIPNYNRAAKLDRLLQTTARQIARDGLYDNVEICVSDDYSSENIQSIVEDVCSQYPRMHLTFHVNEKNMGMDHNFLNSVLMSDAEYCWIIGNDDLPERNSLKSILAHLDSEDENADIFVSPFDIYDENGNVINTIYPIRDDETEVLSFHTADVDEYSDLIERTNNGNALFCFLSNVVFKRNTWIRHGNMFQDKMNTIFIQMYMNLQTLREGAVYRYVPEKWIKNYADNEVNASAKREYDVLVGLSDVIDYFFSGELHRKLQKRIVDERINGRMWDLPDGSAQKQRIMQIDSPKNELYKKYFVESDRRYHLFEGKNILVYGAGEFGKKALIEIKKCNVNSVRVFDADINKWGSSLEGAVIYPARNLFAVYHSEDCVVVVANNKSLNEIVELLCLNGIDEIAIIT